VNLSSPEQRRIAAMRTLHLLALPLLTLLFCLQASSQQPPASSSPVYNIEVIVFRAASTMGAPESWTNEGAGSLDSPEEAEGGAPATTQMGRFVASLPATQFQLNDLANKLKSSGAYVPVAHAAWSQTASPWGTHAGFPVQKLGLDAAGLSGTIFLERGQFLHLGMALNYAMPNPPGGMGAAPGTPFVMNANRRIRFYERNYYDHPAFGVIALVTPAQGGRPAGR
jgi:Peptidoglycan-binding protein, CsiV